MRMRSAGVIISCSPTRYRTGTLVSRRRSCMGMRGGAPGAGGGGVGGRDHIVLADEVQDGHVGLAQAFVHGDARGSARSRWRWVGRTQEVARPRWIHAGDLSQQEVARRVALLVSRVHGERAQALSP